MMNKKILGRQQQYLGILEAPHGYLVRNIEE
jgi:hypothetical protein